MGAKLRKVLKTGIKKTKLSEERQNGYNSEFLTYILFSRN